MPFSPHSAAYQSSTILLNATSSNLPGNDVTVQAPNDFYQKPYAVGPTVEISLPWNFSLAAGMLYERFHQDVSQSAGDKSVYSFGYASGATLGSSASVSANAFAFPLLAKYIFGHRRIKPYIEAGVTLRPLNNFSGEGYQADGYSHPVATVFEFDPGKAIDVAVTAGLGVRYRIGMVDVVPEIRVLHWTAVYEQPVPDQTMLMLTLAFPAHH